MLKTLALTSLVLVSACGRFGFAAVDGGDGSSITDGRAPIDAPSPCLDVSAATTDFTALGAGTLASPYVLCTAGQLETLGTSALAWGDAFAVGSDLDMTGHPTFLGLGTAANPFTGDFDGNGYTIANVKIELPEQDQVGFFGTVIGSAVVIQRVVLANLTISGRDYSGGLVGSAQRANILACATSGTVSGNNYVGGLVGATDQAALVSTSSSSATVIGTASNVGGLVGMLFSGGEVTTSYATGPVTGADTVGGLVGGGDFFAEVWDSYATGSVTTMHGLGAGLVGYARSALVANSFATGAVTSSDAATGTSSPLLAGEVSIGLISNSYYDGGSSCTIAGAACPAPQNGELPMAPLAYFQSTANQPISQWDFARTWALPSGAPPTLAPVLFDYASWGDCSSHLGDTPFAGGFGTPESPYLICTQAQLAAMTEPARWRGTSFRLMADLTLTPMTWTPIGDVPVPAWMIFDGNGKNIDQFVATDMSDREYFGLFGELNGGVKRLSMTNAAVTSNATYAGIIGAAIQGSTIDCVTTGTVSGKTLVGALTATQGGVVADCYSTADVTATAGSAAGVAYAPDQMYDCFGMGRVTGTSNSGQLAGYDTYSGVACAMDAGASTGNGDYYVSSSTCTGCCAPAYGTAELAGYFYTLTNAPMNDWDFVHVWSATIGPLPVLR